MSMARKRKKRKGKLRIDRRLLILFSITPFACLFAILVGLVIAWYLAPTRFVNARASELSQEYVDEIVVMAAADFAETGDIERAKTKLAELEVPNTAQYVSLVAERLIRTNRGPRLADALGVSTVSMISYIITPTPTFTPAPPTATPTVTPVIDTVAQAQNASLEQASAAQPEEPTSTPTGTPIPTDTPVPTPAATSTPTRSPAVPTPASSPST